MALVFPEDRRSYLGGVRFTLVDEFDQPIREKQVELYLPQSIQFPDKVEYENQDLGAVGAAIADGGDKELALPTESLGNSDVQKQLLTNIISKFSDRAGNIARARSKVAPNPNTRALFKQVGLRQFQFSFKLIPTSETEAENIKEIIKLFRTELYPEDIPFRVGEQVLSLGYKFPNRFQVEMTYAGKTIGPKIAPAYMDSFLTNYNSTGPAFFIGQSGNPQFSEIDINFTLTESKTLSRKSIEQEGF